MVMADQLNSLTIASFNINGASRYQKQKDVFDYIRNKNFDIIMLQETHIKSDAEKYIRSLWGYDCFVCGSSSASKGVAILFKNSFTYKVHNIIKDDNGGCYLMLDLEIFNERYTLANIYGPSDRDDPDFFNNIFQIIDQIGNRQVMAGGDWNTLLDPNLDARNYRSFNPKPRSRKIIKEKMENFDLVDIYRKVYPSKRAYSWRRFNTIQQSRLDYILLSDTLIEKVRNVDITPGYRSDHSFVSVTLYDLNCKNKTRSYWKFNNSLLKDKLFIESIKKTINDVKEQYAVPIYNFEEIKNVSNNILDFTINDQLFFETLLMEIRAKTISYSISKKRKDTNEELRISDMIEKLEGNPNLNYEGMLQLEELKLMQQEIRENKIRGMIIRSRVNWLQNGEKPSKYFSKLENRNFTSKRMSFLEKENGEIIYDQNDIISETKSFYQNLYEKRDINQVDLDTLINNQRKLTDVEKESLEGLITYQEASESLKQMCNNKSPGNSGFTTEFYKFFFIDIGHFLVRSINYGFHNNKLSITQRQGVITCLPKEGKNPQFLNNWRPITILNVSYKIASACITNRIKSVLHQLIHSNQSGFLSNRFIGLNIKLMYDILAFTESENIPGMLVLVDFFKAFDSIAWEFIQKVLDFFNFGPYIKNWVKIFYSDVMSCVMVNGKYSEYFPIARGVRQGDPLSPYLFLLCAEVLAQTIRENEQIKGIQLNNEEALLSQFADDTALYLDGSKESFETCIKVLMDFASISGLSINFQKTNVIWLGSKKNSQERFLRDMNFTWDPGGEQNSKFKYLGIIFSTNTSNIVQLNFENKLLEVNKILKTWNKRFLTPFGKITVIKTLALSKLTYLFMNLPDPDKKFISELETMLYKFLWDGKPNKINKLQICQDKENGGLKMVNIEDYIMNLKISMYKKIVNDNYLKTISYAMYPLLANLEKLGQEYIYFVINNVKNTLWVDILKNLKKILEIKQPSSFNEFIAEDIFYNKNICINNKYVFFNSWVVNNVTKIYQLTKDDGSFLSYIEFTAKFINIRTNFLTYTGLIHAVRVYMRKLNISVENVDLDNVQEPVGWLLLKSSKDVIKEAIRKKPNIHNSKNKWNNSYLDLDWKKIFNICHKTTIDTKLKWFQMRLLYRILPTNRFLFLRKIKTSANCDLCQNNVETIEHMLFDCDVIKLFWQNIVDKFISKLPHANSLNLSKQLVIFGSKKHVTTDKPFDIFILCAKYYIYSCKFQNAIPNADIFLKRFKFRYRVEKYYNENIQNANFDIIWLPYQNIISGL